MSEKVFFVALITLVVLPLAIFGCKEKAANAPGTQTADIPETVTQAESVAVMQPQIPEPAQSVAVEAIPPTAGPQIAAEKATPVTETKQERSKDIQKALKNAGFYAGPIDGKIGPKSKKAIEEFQKAKGLKVDGKVGPKTWAELEKYLAQ